jgi:hypothetical protein
VEKIQIELGLPHANTICITEGQNLKNSWVISEVVDGPTLEQLNSIELVASSTDEFCYGVGRSLAFIYMFGLHDVHFGNIHFDGTDVTIRDVEAPFVDILYVKPILTKIKRKISYSACLFHGLNSEGYLINDSKDRTHMVAESLNFFMSPCVELDLKILKDHIAFGFNDFYKTMTGSFKTRIRDIMFYGLNDLARDSEFYSVTMNTIYQPDRFIASAYDDIIDDRFDKNPKQVFEEIWRDINPALIESYRESMN